MSSSGSIRKRPCLWPTFFIVGAPKAGTTSLFNWLGGHPEIFVPSEKETNFFCNILKDFAGPGSDLVNRTLVRTRDRYLRIFEEGQRYTHRGEASTDYLSCPGACARIKTGIPDARIIILLREPVDRAFSEHMHLVREGLETVSFKEAIQLEKSRIDSNWIPLFRHRTRSLYAEGVRRYLELFGRDRVFIATFEELVESPETLVLRICDFLGASPEKVDVSIHFNKSGHVRLRWLHRILRGRSIPEKLKAPVRSALGPRRLNKIRSKLYELNLKPASISPRDRRELQAYFRKDIQEVERMVALNLEHWYS